MCAVVHVSSRRPGRCFQPRRLCRLQMWFGPVSLLGPLTRCVNVSFFSLRCSELDGGGLVQEQFIQSAWKSSAGILVWPREADSPSAGCWCLCVDSVRLSVVQPWELDSSISPENREVIERMLLEEQYPFTDLKRSTRVCKLFCHNGCAVFSSCTANCTAEELQRCHSRQNLDLH